MSEFLGHYECIKCSSSDALALYQDENGYNAFCFSCGEDFQHRILSESPLGQELDCVKDSSNKPRRKSKRKKERTIITEEEKQDINSNTTYKGFGYRKLKDEYNKYFGVRSEYDTSTGKLVKRYYPVTKTKKNEPDLIGYKIRVVEDKSFQLAGKNTKDCDFFGQWRCKGGKYLLLTGGEEDAIAAFQMLRDDQTRRGKSSLPAVDVISSSIGETSAPGQVRCHYEFFSLYDIVVINMDEDEAGERALKQLLDVIPLENIKVMKCPEKDACKALEKGSEREFVSAFYSARRPKLSGIAESSEIIDAIKDVAYQEKVPLPKFLDSVNKSLGGGYRPGSFNVIAAQTSVGKTTVSNEILYGFLMDNRKIGLISLEGSKGQVGEQLISLHLDKRLVEIENTEVKNKIIDDNEEKIQSLMDDEEGDSNLYILDDRTLLEDTDSTFKNIEKLIKACGCEIIIIDVLSDLTDTMTNEQQADFMGKIKKLIAGESVVIVGILHMRKPSENRNPHDISEFDIYGSSTAIKSAHTIILLSRDKMAEDEDERNTTRVLISKNRGLGRTGRMNDIFYDTATGRLREKGYF